MALGAPRLQTRRVYLNQVQESSYIQNHWLGGWILFSFQSDWRNSLRITFEDPCVMGKCDQASYPQMLSICWNTLRAWAGSGPSRTWPERFGACLSRDLGEIHLIKDSILPLDVLKIPQSLSCQISDAKPNTLRRGLRWVEVVSWWNFRTQKHHL